tara:strand:- start:2248 stop:2457 length:210 start_codon:yes stop_codon:yes gene_type:complete
MGSPLPGASFNTQSSRIDELESEVKMLKAVIAEMQMVLDDIPAMNKVWKAIDEIQSDIKPPHGTWIYRL